MQISPNLKIFSYFFGVFLKSTSNLEYFEKKDGRRRLFGFEIVECKKRS